MTRFDSRLTKLEAASRPHDDPAERMREQRLLAELDACIDGDDTPQPDLPPPRDADDLLAQLQHFL